MSASSAMAALGPVILDVAGLSLSARESVTLGRPHVGGVILFSRNYQSVEQLQKLVAEIRSARPDVLIAVDQEGGRVQRLKSGFTRLPPLRKLGQLYVDDPVGALDVTQDCGWLMAAELRAVDIDLSFAPVLDADDHFSEVIGDRAFDKDVEVVCALGQSYINGMREAGMASVGKHFPGHGAVRGDSHVARPVDDRSLQAVWSTDLLPFRVLLHQLDGMMPAHVVFSAVDSSPVGFSAVWLQDILRRQLGYAGVIFSDDLSMEAATTGGNYADRAVAALSSGCDAVLVCNNPAGAAEVLDELEQGRWPISNALRRVKPDSTVNHQSLPQLQATTRWRQAHANLARLLEE